METVHDIQVAVAHDIKDANFAKIQRAEYASAIDAVNEKIAREVPLFLHKYDLVSSGGTRFIDLPVTQGSSVYVKNAIGVVESIGPNHISPISIEKVIRNNQDCREFSFQAIESASRGNSAFKTNDTDLDFRAYCVRINPNATMRLEFVTELGVNEELSLYVTLRLPSQEVFHSTNIGAYATPKWSHFTDKVKLPKLLVNPVYKALKAEIVGILMVREPQPWAELYPLLKQQATEEIYELKRYLLNMKDKSSMGQIQPFKFLSENEAEDYVTNPNIPSEWVSKIII